MNQVYKSGLEDPVSHCSEYLYLEKSFLYFHHEHDGALCGLAAAAASPSGTELVHYCMWLL